MSASAPTHKEIKSAVDKVGEDVQKILTALIPPSTGGGTTTPPPSGKVLTLPKTPFFGDLVPDGVTFGVWYAPTQDAEAMKRAGANLAFNVEHNPPLSKLTDQGIHVTLSPEWKDSETAGNPRVVGRLVGSDEIEMNTGIGEGPARLTQLRSEVAALRKTTKLPIGANFGKGVIGTWWPGGGANFVDFVNAVDFAIADNYAYTSSGVRGSIEQSSAWPAGKSSKCAWAYYWQARQLRLAFGQDTRPVYVTVETAMPYLGDSDRTTITVPQIRAAVWAALIGGAAGVMFFQHNNDGKLPNYSLEDPTLAAAVGKITAEVQTLDYVINSPTYVWDAGPGISSMLKCPGDGYAYLFVIPDTSGPGTKTINLPSGLAATATVVGENRSVSVSRSFTDTFAAETDHHVYKIAIV